MSNEHIIVQTTFLDIAEAREMAKALETEFGATDCQIKTVRSIFCWKGEIDKPAEHVLTAEIRANDFGLVENYISNHHSYELPCIIALHTMPLGKKISRDWQTDCVLVEIIFNNEEAANRVAEDLITQRLSACTKIWPEKVVMDMPDERGTYCLSAETTRGKLIDIQQFPMPGCISSLNGRMILNGKPEFLDWIRDCVASEPIDMLTSVLDSNAAASHLPANHPS